MDAGKATYLCYLYGARGSTAAPITALRECLDYYISPVIYLTYYIAASLETSSLIDIGSGTLSALSQKVETTEESDHRQAMIRLPSTVECSRK